MNRRVLAVRLSVYRNTWIDYEDIEKRFWEWVLWAKKQ